MAPAADETIFAGPAAEGGLRRTGAVLRGLALRWPIALWGLTASCSGPQSTLTPAGRAAESITGLFWWMAAGALIVWAAVILLALYSIRVNPDAHGERTATILIIGGGTILPTVVLTVLLAYGLSLMPEVIAPAPGAGAGGRADAAGVATAGAAAGGGESDGPAAAGGPDFDGPLHVVVSGEEWWWRIRYEPPDGPAVESANELRLPVGRRVEFSVSSPDVIHSFWIPSLGGKIDMIPGRTNHLVLEPTRTGVFRGVCAEYCGMAHALMAFQVVVMEPDAFAAWLERERRPSPAPEGGVEQRGAELFLSNGCGACHAIRGTPADGRVGPDLTHVGGRGTLGAGLLPNEVDAFQGWIARPDAIKPGVHMPGFDMLPDEELEAMAAYLDGLR